MKPLTSLKKIKGLELNGSVIKDKEEDLKQRYQQECVLDSRCISYNFRPIADKPE